MPCKTIRIDGRKVRICWEAAASEETSLRARPQNDTPGADEEEVDCHALAAALNTVLRPLGLVVVEASRAAGLRDLDLETTPGDGGGPEVLRA